MKTKNGSSTNFSAYALPIDESDEKAEQNYIIASDAFTNSYFDSKAGALFGQLFIGKGNFK